MFMIYASNFIIKYIVYIGKFDEKYIGYLLMHGLS